MALYKRIIELNPELALSLSHELALDKSGNDSATKALLSEISSLIDSDIRGAIINEAVDEARTDKVITVNGTDRNISAADGSSLIVFVTTGAADRTITILTEALIAGVKIKIVKVDSGAGKIIVATEGAETIYNQAVSFATIGIWLQNAFIEIISDGTKWIKINSPYIHLMPHTKRNTVADVATDPTLSWVEHDLSDRCPSGTLGLYGFLLMIASGASGGILNIRDGISGATNNYQVWTSDAEAVGHRQGVPMLIKATNGIFDVKEREAGWAVSGFYFHIWGWLL